ncbi:transient receptor potential channel pyrexia-like [Belonocnema kinseyi]|uniref:transient receptor potential channel pyrexia-like n=1 Tax=Belonocnema kinseyi TaxID=2817044 RepID=UPI00143D5382|nr:transient receptor potential channel pyrexia-like [Belonocnema kinseyi]
MRPNPTDDSRGPDCLRLKSLELRQRPLQVMPETIIFPLIFTGMENDIDVEATIEFGGTTGQSGAIRWGISWGLRSFVDSRMIAKMKDCRQQIHSISQSPPPIIIKSKSSHTFENAKIKEMHMLSSPTNDRSQRNYSASHVPDQIQKGNSIFSRLRKAFKSAKSPRKMHSQTISITETNRSEQIQINVGAPPPVDESFFFENLGRLKDVEIDANKIMNLILSNTVRDAEIKILTDMENGNVPERNGILFPDVDYKFRSIAFAFACFRGLSHLLPRLEASGVDINSTDFGDATPVMYAAFAGEIACLKYLIERGANVNYISPRFGHCALHSAAAGNRPETAEILLDNGCDLNNLSKNPDMIPLLHHAIRIKSEAVAELLLERGVDPTYKNVTGETPLHVACSAQSVKCCELLLQKPEVDVNALDEMNRTPLHNAVMAPGSNITIVELLLKHGARVNPIDKTGFSPLHVAALEEHAECVEMLIRNGADVSATTSKGVSALNIILRKIPESLQEFRMKMDSSIKLKRPGNKNREFEMRFDFASLLPSDGKPETSFINTFMQENLTDLLSHPLVSAFLYLKWERIKKFYLLNIFAYTLMLIVMSTYVLTALAYQCYNSNEENVISNNGTNKICYYFDKRVVEFEWYIWLAFVCLMIPRKILSFITHKNCKEYIWNIDNILDTIVIVSVFATSYVYTGKTYHWQKYMGAFSILCAWTNLMFMIGQLPGFGTYVAMFTHIQFEFAKLLFAYSGLLIGFTLSFCVIFDREPAFANLLTGMIKILTMMAGELDFEGLVNHPEGNKSGYVIVYHHLSVCSQILFSLFVIFIVVILMNLLVGIAVHDIKGLLNQAGLTKLIRTTKLIVYMEMAESHMKLSLFLKRLMSNKTDTQIRKHILLVKPLNPLEKRLPGEILKAAYEIAQKNSPILDDEYPECTNSVSYIPKKKEEDTDTTLETAVDKLTLQFKINTVQVLEVMDELRETKRMLEEMVSKLS